MQEKLVLKEIIKTQNDIIDKQIAIILELKEKIIRIENRRHNAKYKDPAQYDLFNIHLN